MSHRYDSKDGEQTVNVKCSKCGAVYIKDYIVEKPKISDIAREKYKEHFRRTGERGRYLILNKYSKSLLDEEMKDLYSVVGATKNLSADTLAGTWFEGMEVLISKNDKESFVDVV